MMGKLLLHVIDPLLVVIEMQLDLCVSLVPGCHLHGEGVCCLGLCGILMIGMAYELFVLAL